MMKLNGLQIEEHGSGFSLTIRVHAGREEFNDGMSDRVTEEALGIFTGVVHSVLAFQAKRYDGSGLVGAIEAAVAKDEPADPETVENAEEAAARVVQGEIDKAAKAAGEPAGGDVAPATRRRRAKAKAKAEGSRDPKADPTGAPTAERKGRRRKKAPPSNVSVQKTDASSTKSDLTDEDLSKVASEAAQSIGAPAVMEILGKFKVEKVNQLKGEQRTKFKASLDHVVAKSDDEIPF